jgi:glycosyltransferase involved in cell wall biosynthesis
MQLIYLADSTLPSQGADAVHVMNMCKAFSENGLEVKLIARKGNNEKNIFEYYGVKKNLFKIYLVERPNIRILGGFIYGWRVNRIFKDLDKPDFIYARSIHALRRINPKKIPFFFESHWKPINKLYHSWEQKLLTRSNLVAFIFISKGLEDIYKKLFPRFFKKFNILHDACNIPNVKINNKTNNRLQVGYIGSFFKGNGYGLIPEMALKMPEIDFHIVGGKEPILSQLKRGNKLINLKFYGHIPHKDLIKIYNRMDVMLAPYQNDLPHIKWVSPMKIFEYMSYKKAIIASDFPVIREVLNEENSILVEPDNIDAWIDSIEKLKAKKIREQLSENGFKLFLNKYTWNKRAKEIIEIYEKNRNE